MIDQTSNNSNFINFLEGYMEKNIATMSPSLNSNLEEIIYNLDLLIDSLKKSPDTRNIHQSLKRSKDILKSKDDIIEIANKFGTHIDNNIQLIEYINKDTKLLAIFKRILYNYVDFAKKCEDNRIIELAKGIAKKLNI